MHYSAIILAGGSSSRMGNDKGLLLLNGKAMVLHIIDVLKEITDDIIIVSNNNEYHQFGIPVYGDLIKESGPLAGIYTGLMYSKHNKSIVLSCDVPFVSVQLLKFLIENSLDNDVAIPSKNNKTHQVIGVYDKNCTKIFKQELDNNQRKIKVALEKVKLNVVDANGFDEKEFTNVNTLLELKDIQ